MTVKRKIVYVILFLIGFAGPFLFVDLFTRGAVKGAINRIFFTPAIIADNFYIDLEQSENPDNERVKFVFAYQSKEGFYGLKRTFISIEGDPIIVFAATENGKIKIIYDHTFDRFGPRKFIIKEADSVVCEPYISKNPASKSKSILKFKLKSGQVEEI
jgi:hypothetical protein